jgi:hypothetical protein
MIELPEAVVLAKQINQFASGIFPRNLHKVRQTLARQ